MKEEHVSDTIAIMHESNPEESAGSRVVSPFSDMESHSIGSKQKGNAVLWVSLSVIFLIVLTIGGLFVFRYMSDPLRTLEPFPVAKFLDSYTALEGSKFRADLHVENDLGWKEGVGRLMVFTVDDDLHPVAVMIPPLLSQIYFTKGQIYRAELEVKDGGLIYANSCSKN